MRVTIHKYMQQHYSPTSCFLPLLTKLDQQKLISWWVSTHLKHMLVKLNHFPRDQGENNKYLKPPPRSNRFSETKHTNLCNASEPLSSRKQNQHQKDDRKTHRKRWENHDRNISNIMAESYIYHHISDCSLNPTVSHQQKIPTSCQSHLPHHTIGTSHVQTTFET